MTWRLQPPLRSAMPRPPGPRFILLLSIFIASLAWARESRAAAPPVPLCQPDTPAVRFQGQPGVRIVVTSFASRSQELGKYLRLLSARYAEAIRSTLRSATTMPPGVRSTAATELAAVALAPCSVRSQEEAEQLAVAWMVDAVVWGLVGAQEATPRATMHKVVAAAGPGESPSGNRSITITGSVSSHGTSLTCVGNTNDCRIYIFHPYRHPLEEPVVPILTVQNPGITVEWDRNESVKQILSVPRAGLVAILGSPQWALLLSKSAEAALKLGQAYVAHRYAETATSQLDALELPVVVSESYRVLGLSALRLQDQHSEESAAGALAGCPEHDAPKRACRGPIWAALAALREQRHQPGPAGQAYESALLHQREAEDDGGELHSLRRLGWLATQQGHADAAVRYYRMALELLSRVPREPELAIVKNDLALVLSLREDASEAQTLFEQAMALHARQGSSIGQAIAHYNLGFLLRKKGDPRQAIEHFLQAAHCYERASPIDWQGRLESLNEAAYLAQRFSEPVKAKAIAEARKRAQELQNQTRVRDAQRR